jgi:hypothetical protein
MFVIIVWSLPATLTVLSLALKVLIESLMVVASCDILCDTHVKLLRPTRREDVVWQTVIFADLRGDLLSK